MPHRVEVLAGAPHDIREVYQFLWLFSVYMYVCMYVHIHNLYLNLMFNFHHLILFYIHNEEFPNSYSS
jgi:hypothetical protein